MSSARGGQFILSNAASWSVFSAAFLLVKPRRASFSSIYRQRRTWTWLRYDKSVQETSRRKKNGHEAFIERHLGKKCWTEGYANPAEVICKTIEHVIRTSCNKRKGVRTSKFYCLTSVKNKRKYWSQTMQNGLKDKTNRRPMTKADSIWIQPRQSTRQKNTSSESRETKDMPWKVGALSPTELQFLLLDRWQKQKVTLFKYSRVVIRTLRTNRQGVKNWSTQPNVYCLTVVENKRNVGRKQCRRQPRLWCCCRSRVKSEVKSLTFIV